MLAIAIVAAASWLALYLGCAAVTSDRHLRRGMRRARLPGGPPDLGDPALVNLVTSGCQLNAAALAATILHLGSRGLVALSEPEPGRLWCAPTPESAGEEDLAAYERLVLGDVTRQFAEAGGAPFKALAGMCFADVKGVWDPFEEAVRTEGRHRGLTRARLPKPALALLCAGAAAVAGLAAVAVGAANSTGWAGAVFFGLFVLVILAVLTGALGRNDRLTLAGAALAAWAARVTAEQAPPGITEPDRLALLAATLAGDVRGWDLIRTAT
jgi:hypothetical protein